RHRTTCPRGYCPPSCLRSRDNVRRMGTQFRRAAVADLTERRQRRSVEALFAPVRWGGLALVLLNGIAEHGVPALTWLAVALIFVTAVTVEVAIRRSDLSAGFLRVFGVVVLISDFVATTLICFSYASEVDSGLFVI